MTIELFLRFLNFQLISYISIMFHANNFIYDINVGCIKGQKCIIVDKF